MFKHENNKWSCDDRRKLTFSTACRKEQKKIYLLLKAKNDRKVFLKVSHRNTEDKDKMLCESKTYFSVLEITRQVNDYAVSGFNSFEAKDNNLARIYKKLIAFFEELGKDVYSLGIYIHGENLALDDQTPFEKIPETMRRGKV